MLHDLLGSGRIVAVFRAADRLNVQEVTFKQVTAPTTQLNFASPSVDRNLTLALAQEFRILAALCPPVA